MKSISLITLWITSLLGLLSAEGQAKSSRYQGKQRYAYISIKMDNPQNTDTFTLFVYKNILTENTNKYLQRTQQEAVEGKDGLFKFKIPNVTHPEYFTLAKDRDTLFHTNNLIPMLNLYLIEPGDSVQMSVVWDSAYHADQHIVRCIVNYKLRLIPMIVNKPEERYLLQYNLQFTGRGAAKYRCRYLIDKAERYSLKIDSLLAVLSNFKDSMSKLSYGVLHADIIGHYECVIYYSFHNRRRGDSLRAFVDKYFHKVSDNNDIPYEAKVLSRYYPQALLVREYYKYPHLLDSVYEDVKRSYTGFLRDKLITMEILTNHIADSTGILNNALQTVKTGYCLEQVKRVYGGQAIGSPAYDFSLEDTSGNKVRLSDFRGKVVFIDFWFTGCSACAGFYQETLSHIEKEYKTNSNVAFITISVDAFKQTWLRSIGNNRYTSPDIINLYTGGAGEKNPVIDHYNVIGYPQPYIIDTKGRIYAVNIYNKKKIETDIRKALVNK